MKVYIRIFVWFATNYRGKIKEN
jgi:hypothetical protein